MAKRRRSRNKVRINLKFEIYGILLILFAWITIAGKGVIPSLGPVGWTLSSICFFVAGEMFFVLPFIAIYTGLYVMVKREWPSRWSYRKTGLLLFFIAIAIHLHIDLFRGIGPDGGYKALDIFAQPFHNLNDLFALENGEQAFKENVGGGFVGAASYGLLFFLFSTQGARFVEMALFAIGFICLTGLSYVDLAATIKKTFVRFFKQLSIRVKEWFPSPAHKAVKKRTTKPKRVAAVEDQVDPQMPGRKQRRKPMFFQLFQSPDSLGKETSDKSSSHGETDVRETTQEETVYTAAPDHLPESGESSLIESAAQAVPEIETPIFHDFQDHVPDYNQAEMEQEAIGLTASESLPHADTAETVDGVGSGDSNEGGSEAEVEGVEIVLEQPEPEKPYLLPSFQLLSRPSHGGKAGGGLDYKANARKLEATMESFGVRAKVLEVVRGPAVTRYEIQPDVGVKVSRIVGLTDDIALALAAKDIRMEAPIPGKAAIGIEVPNMEVAIVSMREVMESSSFHESAALLSIALGRDISGQPIVANLAKMPHLLVAGATGSGKSVCINGIIISILYKAKPDEVKFLMVDPKMVELNMYNGIPHLLAPVVTDPRRASLALKKVVKEMEHRYELFSKSGTRNMEGYNNLLEQKGEKKLPYIVVIVDELADLMMVAANDVEDAICRLAQMARAAGIHLIIATQRPSVDVITGVIKANIPSRIAFGVSSQVDSRTILDSAGAEKLLGRGDMLFVPVGASKAIRIQGAFLSDQEVETVVDFVRTQREAEYREEMVPEVDDSAEQIEEFEDELYDQAVQIILEAKQASVSLLQRRMRIGYTRAARLIDSMEAKGVVGPYEGSKPREVLISMEQYRERRISS